MYAPMKKRQIITRSVQTVVLSETKNFVIIKTAKSREQSE
jgi:hypothetical protein